MRQRTKPVGVEGLEGSDSGEIQQFRVRQCRFYDKLSVFNIPGRAGIFFDHINRRKYGLVFIRPFPDFGKSTHHVEDVLRFIKQVIAIADEHIAHAGGHAHVHDGRDIVFKCQFIQHKGIFDEKGDIHHVFACADDGLQGAESHESRHRVDHHVVTGNQGGHPAGIGQVGNHGCHAARYTLLPFYKGFECPGVDIGNGYLKGRIFGKVDGHRTANQPCTQNNYFHDFRYYLILLRVCLLFVCFS